MVIVILALSVILAVVLLVAAVVSFMEYRNRSRPRDACRLLDKQLRLEEQALDAHREMLRTDFAPQNRLFCKIFPACSFDKTREIFLCKRPQKVSYRSV